MVLAMLHALVDRGHEVDVLLSQRHPEITSSYEIGGITVHPHRGKEDPFRFLADTDVIVTHLENTPRAAALGESYRIPVAKVVHNTFTATRGQLKRGISLAVYNSEWMAEEFADLPVDSVVVRPPVAVADYATTPGDCITLINLYEPKGPKTFYALAERFPNLRFLAVHGAYGHQVLRDLPNVEHVEHLDGDRMRDAVYARTRILLMPSDYESWGRAGVEAMCSGIPVIAHPTPGLRESLGEAGIFCDRRKIDDWEAAINSLLKPRAYAAASKKAKARAAELDPAEDIERWIAAMEILAVRRAAFRHLATA
ncbi:glycosyltransferase family 4 protein [Streptosporangium sp. CA-115845]|uniref:glycosyltransferase family 4 protein n=1 Tax=Streptosporangium sp. CA-115845 TaxID=3240071 RepID=UPI003D8DCC60